MRCYEPAPEHRPLLRHRPRWAGGLTVAAFLLVAVLAIPAVYGACALVWALDGAYHQETAR